MSDLAKARFTVRTKLGRHFEEKASDALCGFLAPSSGVMESLLFAVSPAALPIRRQRETVARTGVEASLVFEVETADEPEMHPTGRTSFPANAIGDRHAEITRLKDAFQKKVASLRSDIEQKASKTIGPERAARDVRSIWLVDALRTPWLPQDLADLAGDNVVKRLDVPRKLQRELDVTCGTIGVRELRAGRDIIGRNIRVAIVDGEVAGAHAGLSGRVIRKGNFTREPVGPADPHGTAVAGIIAGVDATYGGVAPGVTIYSYKLFATNDSRLDGDDLAAAEAIQQAIADNAQVVNCSWGSPGPADGTSREVRMCDRAWRLGLTVVKSAGNAGPGGQSLSTPADAAGVIVVGATDRHGKTLASYSSWGKLADGTFRPHLLAPGGDNTDGIFSCVQNGGFASCGFGTSLAAPHVTGLVALLLEADPSLTPDGVRQELLKRCSPIADASADRQGAGLVFVNALA